MDTQNSSPNHTLPTHPAPCQALSSLPELALTALEILVINHREGAGGGEGGRGRGHLRKPALFTGPASGGLINCSGHRISQDNITQQLGHPERFEVKHSASTRFTSVYVSQVEFLFLLDLKAHGFYFPVSGHLGRWQASRKLHSRPATASSFPAEEASESDVFLPRSPS